MARKSARQTAKASRKKSEDEVFVPSDGEDNDFIPPGDEDDKIIKMHGVHRGLTEKQKTKAKQDLWSGKKLEHNENITDLDTFDDPLMQQSLAFERVMHKFTVTTVIKPTSLAPTSEQELRNLAVLRQCQYLRKAITKSGNKNVWRLFYEHRENEKMKWKSTRIDLDETWTAPQVDRMAKAIRILLKRMPALAGGITMYRIIRDLAHTIIGLDAEQPRVVPWVGCEINQSRGKKKLVWTTLTTSLYYVNPETKKLELVRLNLEPATISELDVPALPANHVFARNSKTKNTERYADDRKKKEALLSKSKGGEDTEEGAEDVEDPDDTAVEGVVDPRTKGVAHSGAKDFAGPTAQGVIGTATGVFNAAKAQDIVKADAKGVAGTKTKGAAGTTAKGFVGSAAKGTTGSTTKDVAGPTVEGAIGAAVKNAGGAAVKDVAGPAVKGVAGASVKGVAGASVKGVAGASVKGVAGAPLKSVAGTTAEGVSGAAVKGVAGAAAQSVAGAPIEGFAGHSAQEVVGFGAKGGVDAGASGIGGLQAKDIMGTGHEGVIDPGTGSIVDDGASSMGDLDADGVLDAGSDADEEGSAGIKSSTVTTDPYECIPATVSEDRPQYEAAVRIMRHFQILWQGMVGTKADILAAWRLFNAQYTNTDLGRKKKGNGPYGGSRLYFFHRRDSANSTKRRRYVGFSLSRNAVKTVSATLPWITVESHDTCRFNSVGDIMEQKFITGSGLILSWLEAARMADRVNVMIAAGEPAQDFCVCDVVMRSSTCHPCGICGIRVLCARLLSSDVCVQRVCKACIKKIEAGDDPLSEGEDVSDNEAYFITMKRNLKRHLWRELSIILDGKDKKRIKKLRSEVIEKVWPTVMAKQPSLEEWEDIYTGKRDTVTYKTRDWGRHVRDPFMPSVEAVWPFTLMMIDGELVVVIHGEGNVAVTALCLNTGKAYFLPAALQILADFLNLSPAKAATDHERLKFFNLMQQVRLAGLLTPYTRAKRLKGGMTTEKLEHLRKAWLLGRPTSSLPKGRLSSQSEWLDIEPKYDAAFRPPGFDRVVKLAKLIQVEFNHRFKWSKDGAPFPWHESAMPKKYNICTAWRFFVDRTHRMYVICNGRWIMVDTPETIWIECLWQAANPDKKSKLDLPFDVKKRSAIRATFGKIHHNKPMATGWKPEPTSLDDRDDSKCNISVETHIENVLKMNFPEDTWDEIFDLVRSVKRDDELWDRDGDSEGEGEEDEEDGSEEEADVDFLDIADWVADEDAEDGDDSDDEGGESDE